MLDTLLLWGFTTWTDDKNSWIDISLEKSVKKEDDLGIFI